MSTNSPRQGRRPASRRSALRLGLLLLALPLLSSCWYVTQTAYFLQERLGGKDLQRLAGQADTPQDLKDFAGKIDQIRRFAVTEAGLKPTKNYTRYVMLDRDYVASVVSACAADSFDRHYWRYPVLGALPYKGFYEAEAAQAEADRLKAAGLDVIIRKVDGFSSLGIFRDPLYSFMLDYRIDELADLIFHESAHATLFIKGADQFNEEFATFVGSIATDLFLEASYGADNAYSLEREARQADRAAFRDFLKETAAQLELVYSDATLARDRKIEKKQQIIQTRAELYKNQAEHLFADQRYREFDMNRINNAYLDLYRLYEEDLNLYLAWFDRKAERKLPLFISQLQLMAKQHGKQIKQAMQTALDK